MTYNYTQICANLLKDLPERQKTIISRRFNLNNLADNGRGETLEVIGGDYGITRERVRQIENDGFLKLKSKTKQYDEIFQNFSNYLKNNGGLKREDIFLEEIGRGKFNPQVSFLLNLGDDFSRIGETDEFYPLWTIDKKFFEGAKKIVSSAVGLLKKNKKILPLDKINFSGNQSKNTPISYLEISKKIQQSPEGFFGLKDWPEVNPRGVKDKAYLTLKKEQKPLHFSQLAQLINAALPQTVHNELIKDPRFVLVGRGIYALKEWGYEEGYVKDVIAKILKEAGRALPKEKILEKVLKQRFVKENTVLLNLSNKNYFSKNPRGFYELKVKEI